APAPAAMTTSPGAPIVPPGGSSHPEPTVRPERSGERVPFFAASSWMAPLYAVEQARTEAHRAFLRVAEGTVDLLGRLSARQLEWSEGWPAGESPGGPDDAAQAEAVPSESSGPLRLPAALFDRGQCLQLAVGSVAAVLGPEFQEVDRLPTRVRLP